MSTISRDVMSAKILLDVIEGYKALGIPRIFSTRYLFRGIAGIAIRPQDLAFTIIIPIVAIPALLDDALASCIWKKPNLIGARSGQHLGNRAGTAQRCMTPDGIVSDETIRRWRRVSSVPAEA